MVALLLAVRHFSLAICPGACCLAALLVLRPNAACTCRGLSPVYAL